MLNGLGGVRRIASSQLRRWLEKHSSHQLILFDNLTEKMQRGFYCYQCQEGAECALEAFDSDTTLKLAESVVSKCEDGRIVRRPYAEKSTMQPEAASELLQAHS